MKALKNFKILDCTLRDGGYYTNWDFDKVLVFKYFESFNKLPVEYLEIGYRSNPMNSYLGEYFYCPPYVLKESKEYSNKKLVVILNEKDVRAEHVPSLLGPCRGYIDMIRIAIDPKNFKRALGLAAAVKKEGFEVSFNVMYMSNWESERDFLDQLKEVNGLADYLYMVDSYGGVYPEDVRKTYNLIREKTSVEIGFHGHNNLELGLINTLTAIDMGASIVDATVTGMGRGAGNLKMELLLTALNSKYDLDVDFNSLSEITSLFSEMQLMYGWGTNLPYMVSGGNSLPQKEVMEWVSKRFYSFNSIVRALHNQKSGIEDNRKFPILKSNKTYDKVIIIGGGPSVSYNIAGIKEFINKNKSDDICLIHASSRNSQFFKDLDVDHYFCLIGSEGVRLEKTLDELENLKVTCILPPFPRKMGTYVPSVIDESTFEMENFQHSDLPQDSATLLSLELSSLLGEDAIYIVGYDGYSDAQMGQKEHELFLENDNIFEKFKNSKSLASLTPTKYRNLEVESIYSKL